MIRVISSPSIYPCVNGLDRSLACKVKEWRKRREIHLDDRILYFDTLFFRDRHGYNKLSSQVCKLRWEDWSGVKCRRGERERGKIGLRPSSDSNGSKRILSLFLS